MSRKKEMLTMLEGIAEMKCLDPASFTNIMMNIMFDEDDYFEDDDDEWIDEE